MYESLNNLEDFKRPLQLQSSSGWYGGRFINNVPLWSESQS